VSNEAVVGKRRRSEEVWKEMRYLVNFQAKVSIPNQSGNTCPYVSLVELKWGLVFSMKRNFSKPIRSLV
jgi:hypothetical protein